MTAALPNMAPPRPWTPARVMFITARFAGRCHWCAAPIAEGTSVAYYADEHAIAHEGCHGEACP